MSDPKADCQILMDSVLSLAEQMLAAHGEFVPFGSAMRPDGQLVSIAGYDGDEHPETADIMALLREEFISGARNGDYKATAVAYDVRVRLPSAEEKSDAIAISLNHRDNYSVVVVVPYMLDADHVSLGTIFAQKGEADIFPMQ